MVRPKPAAPVKPTAERPAPASERVVRTDRPTTTRTIVAKNPASSASALSTRSVAPGAPAITKGDKPRRLGYRTEGGNAIEVAGVCRFSESEVVCWDAQGRTSDLIAANVRSALTDKDRLGRTVVEFGRKNRIVVVRNEQPPFGDRTDQEQTLRIDDYGTPGREHGSGNIVDLRVGDSTPVPGKPFVTYSAFAVAEDEGTRETGMRIAVSKPMPTTVDLSLKKGASVLYGGCRFTVTDVGKRDPSKGGFFGGSPDEVWTVRVRRSGEPSQASMFSIGNASVATYVDASGKVVGDGPYQAYWKARSDEYRKTGKHFDVSEFPFKRILLTGFAFPKQTEFEVTTNVDPRRIGKVRLLGTTVRAVEVTGIPLDPK